MDCCVSREVKVGGVGVRAGRVGVGGVGRVEVWGVRGVGLGG